MLETQSVASIPAETREPRVFDLRYLPWGSLLIIALLVFVALGAPLLTPYSPIEQALPDKLQPPAWEKGGRAEHLLGTDMFGRDMLARLCYGARVSLLVIASSLPVGGGVGLLIGLLSGYIGGRVDIVLMRIVDAALAFPTVLFALLLAVTMGQGLAHAHDCHRALVVGALRARHARGGVGSQDTGFCSPSAGAGVFALAHHDGPHSAERHEHLHGLADAARRRRGIRPKPRSVSSALASRLPLPPGDRWSLKAGARLPVPGGCPSCQDWPLPWWCWHLTSLGIGSGIASIPSSGNYDGAASRASERVLCPTARPPVSLCTLS